MSVYKNTFSCMMMVSILALSACQNFKEPAGIARVDSAIVSAANDAANEGQMGQSLAFHEKLYNKDPNNADFIIHYASALRRMGRVDDAILVIRTPAKDPQANHELLTEAALVLISAAEYKEANDFAKKAVVQNEKSPDAYHALALSQSGLENFTQAQTNFQKALNLWPKNKDQTSVINNLAMSLTAQGKISEARKVMSLATGEALRSRTYQNNRALLDVLKDIPQEKATSAPEVAIMIKEELPPLPAPVKKPMDTTVVKNAVIKKKELINNGQVLEEVKVLPTPNMIIPNRKMRPILDE